MDRTHQSKTSSHADAITHLPRLPKREQESHKGTYGRALLVGGSRGMSGAIALAGMAALRSGAGLVRLALPQEILPIVASFEPSYMTSSLPQDAKTGTLNAKALKPLLHETASATALGCGPGLGRSRDVTQVVEKLYRAAEIPAVFDADALYALAERRAVLSHHAHARILTPHPGEFARLLDVTVKEALKARERLADDFASLHGVVLVVKGNRTYITDGKRRAINGTGNPGMATGGTGDVLTGIVTGLLAQGMQPFEAAVLGAHVHGLAGDLAAKDLGEVSLIASDLLKYLPQAFQITHS